MTINAFNGAFASVLNRDNRLQNVGQQTQPRNTNAQTQAVQPPALTQLAEQVVTQINQSQNLSAGFKRDAIALASVIDAAAPPTQREGALRALAGQVAGQVKANAQAPAVLDDGEVVQIIAQAREQIFGRPQGEDTIDLTVQTRARNVVAQFKDSAVAGLGQQAVAAIFGEPPGVKQPDTQPTPDAPQNRLPHEQLEHLAEVRQQMVDIIEG